MQIPIFTFSLALVKDGKPIVGVANDPFMNRLFFAEFGQGAFLNGKKIKVNRRGLKNSAISWESLSARPNLRKLTGALPFALLSYVYGAVLVACGELSAAFYPWYHAHDAAAVKIIVEEAGGKVTDMRGKDQRYDREVNGCLASNGVVHARLLAIIKKHYKGRLKKS